MSDLFERVHMDYWVREVYFILTFQYCTFIIIINLYKLNYNKVINCKMQ